VTAKEEKSGPKKPATGNLLTVAVFRQAHQLFSQFILPWMQVDADLYSKNVYKPG
jgi:hypothetical protein